MATGDLRGVLRKLELHLRSLKYPREADYVGLAKGDPSSFLPVLNYAFLSYSSYLAEDLIGFGVELAGKNDHRFLEAIYKVLRDVFTYKPLLTKEQFLQFGFAERKIAILCDIIGFVTEKHRELSKNCKTKSKARFPRVNRQAVPEGLGFEASALKPTGLAAPPPKPLVERHLSDSVPTVSHSSSEEFSSEDKDREEEGEEEDENESLRTFDASPVERRLQALEAQALDYQRKLERLSVLEARLAQLERDTAGKIVINRQDWDNLESRVLLLETRLALSAVQKTSSLTHETENVAGEFATVQEAAGTGPEATPWSPPHRELDTPSPPASATAINPFVLTADPKESIKERLERIAAMMNETSSLLRSTEPSM